MKGMEEAVFYRKMEDKVKEIEKMLVRTLPQEKSLQKTIFEAMDYSVMAGGKRLRPMLMLESYTLFGGTETEVIEMFMAALEMIHTYSLVHDDLPAMDNDDFRRGRKTTHTVFGEDIGILAGDALLNYAYETAVKGVSHSSYPERGIKALEILSRKAGIYGMVGGQVVDVEMTGKPLTADMLDFIYRLKTGALLEAALMIGAVLAGASDEAVSCMENIGKNVGLAFQIQDDILDVTSTTQELGKPVGSDEKNEKTTYVSLYGMDQAKQAVEDYSEEALACLASLPVESVYMNTLIKMLIHRKK